jgi:hypothetical protein
MDTGHAASENDALGGATNNHGPVSFQGDDFSVCLAEDQEWDAAAADDDDGVAGRGGVEETKESDAGSWVRATYTKSCDGAFSLQVSVVILVGKVMNGELIPLSRKPNFAIVMFSQGCKSALA